MSVFKSENNGIKRRNMTKRKHYTQEEVDEFVELAQIKGIAPAIRELGYPSYPGAQKWFKEKGLEMPTVDSLMAKAAELKVFYGDSEKKASLQIAIDRIIEELQEKALNADEINKLSNALSKLLQTYQLIEGKATQVTEKHEKDSTDLAINKLLDDMRNANERKANEIA